MKCINFGNALLPLTTAQTGIWLAQKFMLEFKFNLAEAIEIHGPINPGFFQAALRQLTQEAEALRVRVVEGGEGPSQIIRQEYDGDIPFIDFSTESDPRDTAGRWITADYVQQLDLLTDELWFSAVLKIAEDTFIWYHRCHHILMDGLSAGLCTRRVAELYSALVEVRPPSEATEFGSLAEVLTEEASYRRSDRFVSDREYWMARFVDTPSPITLSNRKPANGSLLRNRSIIKPGVVRSLRVLAQSNGASLPQTLIALITAYLYRMTGAEDLIVGFTVTARANARMRRTPAMLANVVPLRLRMGPALTIRDLIRQVGAEVRQCLRHQQYRYEDLRRDLNLLSNNQQLFTMVVNVEPFDYDLQFGGCPMTPQNLSNGSTNDLGIFIYDREDDKGLCIDLDANSALYTAEELAVHQQRLLRLIESVVCTPSRCLSQIDILDPGERRQILEEWSGRRRPVEAATFPALFEAQATQHPTRPALILDAGVLSYAELNARANQLAHYLIGRDIGPGKIVAIVQPRSMGIIVSVLGVLKAGAAYLPIDPSYPSQRIAFMLADAQPTCVITDSATAASLAGAAPRLMLNNEDTLADLARQPQHDPTDTERTRPLDLLDAAYVIYTSGSTGIPKGVVVSHAGIASLAVEQAENFAITSDSRVLQFASVSFDASVMEFLMAFPVGAALVVPAPGPLVGDRLAEELTRYAVSHALIPPAVLVGLPTGRYEALRTLLVGGDTCPPDLVELWSEDRRMINAYGPTETTIVATLSDPLSGRVIPPIGRPIRNTQVYVLDPGLQPVAVGVPGELYVAGASLARGYLDRPDLTAQHFVAAPYGPPGSRMYRTGDLVCWRADGCLDFLGRIDRQVKLRGFRIEPGEIEAALIQTDTVAQAAVIARRDELRDRYLAAYVVLKTGAVLDPAALRHQLTRQLPDYMVPATFTSLDALPLTPSGKLDHKALPTPQRQSAADYVAPRTPTEATLMAIWAEILGLEQVGIEDNFFELGGHSMLVAQLITRVKVSFAVDLPLAMVFEVSTIVGLAEKIDQAIGDGLAVSSLDLAAEACQGDDDIRPLATLPRVDFEQVFLTGATGFVGSQTLGALLRNTDARIVCLVRAMSPGAARTRLRRTLTVRRLAELWDEHRIVVLMGDLNEPDLGLDEDGIAIIRDKCDAIFHCGAMVDFLQPYSTLKASNVTAVRRLIGWTASGRPKTLHYVSTLSIVDPTSGPELVTEASPLSSWRGLIGGYIQSKWVGDTLARQAQACGLPVAVYRLGFVTGNRTHGICSDNDMIWRLVRASARLGAIPDIHLTMTPADDIADAILRLARSDKPWGGVYHLAGPGTVHLRDMVPILQRMGLALKPIPLVPWLERARLSLLDSRDPDLATLVALIGQFDPSITPPRLCFDATRARMEEVGGAIPSIGLELIERYLRNLKIPGSIEMAKDGTCTELSPVAIECQAQQPDLVKRSRKARFIIAATALPGHVLPLLGIAHHLVGRGHEVVVHAGHLFQEKVEATGARFARFRSEIDLDYRRIDEYFPDHREMPRGLAKMMFDMKHLICNAMQGQKAGLDEILSSFPADAILVDNLFAGALPMLLGPRESRPTVVTIGITALAATSVDTAFFGSGMPPSSTSEGRARNLVMHRNMQTLYAGMQQELNDRLAAIGYPPLPEFMLDSFVTLPDHYLQLTSESFEYPRSDLSETVRFVGPLLSPPTKTFDPPGWWTELDGSRPVVLVTQGTLANEDFGQLIGPTLTGLADEDVLVIVTTGGPSVETIPVQIPTNARVECFLPYDRLLPMVNVLVTNGGYGSVNHALSLGVPIVIAGDTEEKPEIAARVAWSGVGINLSTGQPRPEQIRDAVCTVLSDPRYQRQAQALQADFSRHDARREIATILEDLVPSQEVQSGVDAHGI